ncbi:hypothetical protein pb186bvf_019976 [Paramecium bursaria]
MVIIINLKKLIHILLAFQKLLYTEPKLLQYFYFNIIIFMIIVSIFSFPDLLRFSQNEKNRYDILNIKFPFQMAILGQENPRQIQNILQNYPQTQQQIGQLRTIFLKVLKYYI